MHLLSPSFARFRQVLHDFAKFCTISPSFARRNIRLTVTKKHRFSVQDRLRPVEGPFAATEGPFAVAEAPFVVAEGPFAAAEGPFAVR